VEDLLTTEEEELDVIIGGLELQAEELEDEAEATKKSAQAFGFMALLAAVPAVALNYVPENWPYEKEQATALFVVMALTTSVQIVRQRRQVIKARRKRQLADRLQEEADMLELVSVY